MEIILTIYGIGCVIALCFGFMAGVAPPGENPTAPANWVRILTIICIPGFLLGILLGSGLGYFLYHMDSD